MVLTKKQYDVLLYLRKKPRTLEDIKKKFKPEDDWDLENRILPSDDLYSRGQNKKNLDVIELTDEGLTYAQAEHDRRYDMRFTRIMALLALIVSFVALILEVAGIVLSLLCPQ